MRAFIDAIGKEALFYKKKYGTEKIRTLYLGGGTPSMLSPTLLKKLFENLHDAFDLSSLDELTFEANPATFNLEKAKLFKELGITRISLGIQSFDDNILKTLGREHTREQALETVPLLREAGIPEINIDLMFAIPGQSLDSWQDTVETAISLKPDHISAYNLTYEEDTEFIDKLTSGEYIDDPEVNAQYFTLADKLLTETGFEHYETSNYAKPNKKSTHNLSYWQGSPYLGLGPSAVSTIDNTRWKNTPDTAKYIAQINHTGHAQTEIENLTEEDIRIERIALMLRTTQGISKTLLSEHELQKTQTLADEGLITILQESISTTERGSLLVDAIVEHIL
eukprot:Seg15654.1 transcript_id=Seg15654.1/GoldUCD/mRNA.D3Y31 product="Oxygen-independent coproporphyrinogen-III oxidase-like protein YqeR" protein_id=Seg15654.1/GoldUCD/D3Y31